MDNVPCLDTVDADDLKGLCAISIITSLIDTYLVLGVEVDNFSVLLKSHQNNVKYSNG